MDVAGRAGLRRALVWAAAACASLAWVGASLAGTVRLKGTAVVEPGAAVRLGDIAVLDGAGPGLGEIVVLEDPGAARGEAAWVEVGIDEVREALAGAGMGSGRVAVSGSRCVVRFVGAGLREEEAQGEQGEEPRRRRAEVVDVSGPPTVRTRVVDLLRRIYGVGDAGSLRLLFDQRDEDLLAMEEWGRRVVVRPATSGAGPRVLVDVRVVSGEEVVASAVIGVDVEVRRRVVVMERDVERHERLTPGMVREVEMWVSPRGERGPDSADEVAGQRARRPLRAGEVVRGGDVEAAIVVERGALVSVLCVKGGIGVQARGRAMEDGREGDVIECRLVDSRKSFEARVDGPGRVVVVLE